MASRVSGYNGFIESMAVLVSQDNDIEVENSCIFFDFDPLSWGIKGIEGKFPGGQMPLYSY